MKKNIWLLALVGFTVSLHAEPWFKQQQQRKQEQQHAPDRKPEVAQPKSIRREIPTPTRKPEIPQPVKREMSTSTPIIKTEPVPKILHMSFHLGCTKEVEYVANKLGLNVTSWYIFDKPLVEFEGRNSGLEIYNMLPDRAQRIWEKNKDYFNEFDIIWISDTSPLCRVFLQNNWKKPLLIWICNRFDYRHHPSEFPDPEYHELFRKAAKQENVFIIPYSPYEWYYAYTKGVYLNTFTIKPIGAIEDKDRYKHPDKSVPTTVDKKNSMLIYPRLNPTELTFVKDKCEELDVKYYSGPYNGSNDIKDFKGIIFFIYGAWLNIAMFENFQRGLVHFLPSVDFMEELKRIKAPVSGHPYVLNSRLYELCEWYAKEHRDLLVFYDSWDDLKHKIETTDYDAMKKRIITFAQNHEQDMLNRWRMVFDDMYKQHEKSKH